MKVLLKSYKELMKLGFSIDHVSDDGEFMRFSKGGVSVGLWTNHQYEPHLVVNYPTVHENLIKLWPEAWTTVEEVPNDLPR